MDGNAFEYAALVGGKCGLSPKYPTSTEHVPLVECCRSIEDHFTKTLEASFVNCGLQNEAHLLLARVGKFQSLCI